MNERPDEINFINLLSFAPGGILFFDIIRIVHLIYQEKPYHECMNFGNW